MFNQQPNNNGQRDHRYNMTNNVRFDGTQRPAIGSSQNNGRGIDPGHVVDPAQWGTFRAHQTAQYQAGQTMHQAQDRPAYQNSRATFERPYQGIQAQPQPISPMTGQHAHQAYNQGLHQDLSNALFQSPIQYPQNPQQMLSRPFPPHGTPYNPQFNNWAPQQGNPSHASLQRHQQYHTGLQHRPAPPSPPRAPRLDGMQRGPQAQTSHPAPGSWRPEHDPAPLRAPISHPLPGSWRRGVAPAPGVNLRAPSPPARIGGTQPSSRTDSSKSFLTQFPPGYQSRPSSRGTLPRDALSDEDIGFTRREIGGDRAAQDSWAYGSVSRLVSQAQPSHTGPSRKSSQSGIGPSRPTPHGLSQMIKDGGTEDNSSLNSKCHRDLTSLLGKSAAKRLVHGGLGSPKHIPNPLWLGPVQERLSTPTAEELLRDLPITELHRKVAPSNAGVIKLCKVPPSITRKEIVALVEKHTRILRQPEGSTHPAVHILMDRDNGRTTDCYVELESPGEAAHAAHSLMRRGPPRFGDRSVTVEYSTQDKFLSALFPRAKHVQWNHGEPIVDMIPRVYVKGEMAAGFQGFIQPEEFRSVRGHASRNSHSIHASQGLTRPYETLISILHKYPWHTPRYIPIFERDDLYDLIIELMTSLISRIGAHSNSRRGTYTSGDLCPDLLQEMVTAALVCPGLSEFQKATIVHYLDPKGYNYMAEGQNLNIQHGGRHELAAFWPFVALSVTPGADIELVKFYGRVFFEATCHRPVPGSAIPIPPMGHIEIKYNDRSSPSDLSLATAAKIENAKIEGLIKKFAEGYIDYQLRSFLSRNTIMPTAEFPHKTFPRLEGIQSAGQTQPISGPQNARSHSTTQADVGAQGGHDGRTSSIQGTSGAQNSRGFNIPPVNTGAQGKSTFGLKQASAGAQNNHVCNSAEQALAELKLERANQLASTTAGTQNDRGGYSLAQAIQKASSRASPAPLFGAPYSGFNAPLGRTGTSNDGREGHFKTTRDGKPAKTVDQW